MIIILLIASVVVAMFLTAVRPVYSLIFGMLLMYNPVYSFFVINLHGFEEAKIRVALSLLTMAMLVNVLVFNRCFNSGFRRHKTVIDRVLLLLIPFVIFSFVTGIVLGHSLTEVLASSFPFVEGVAFFFLTGYVIKERTEVRLLYILLAFWVFINFLPAIFLYLKFGSVYFFKLRFGSVHVGRLTDFMVSLICPMLFAYLIHSKKSLEKKVLLLLLLLGLLVIVLGSFRSVWIGVVASFIYLMLTMRSFSLSFKKLVSGSVVICLAMVAVIYMWKSDVFHGLNIIGMLTSRLSIESLHEGSSYSGRLATYYAILHDSFEFPYLLVGHGFGSEFEMGGYMALKRMPISSSPNFYLNVLYEAGFVSSFFIFSIGAYVLWRIRWVYKNAVSYETRRASLALLGGIISTGLVFTMFPAVLHFPIIPLVSIFMALIFSMDSCDRAQNSYDIVP